MIRRLIRDVNQRKSIRQIFNSNKYCSSTQRWMSTVMSFGDGSQGALGLPPSLTGINGDAYEPTTVPGLPSDIISIAAGHYHSLAVTSHGELWTWGRDQEGQLGRGLVSTRDSWSEPGKVKGLDHVRVEAAFASGVVSAAIGDDGSLWVWGKSKRGQLGIGRGVMEAVVPTRVEALEGERIAKVSLGWGHALAMTQDGKLFGWGYSADGRLGKMGKALGMSPQKSSPDISYNNHEDMRLRLEIAEKEVLEKMENEKNMPIIWKPCLVDEIQDVEVVDIACGLDHSLILCGTGRLFSCGSNIYGQLGRTSEELGLFPVDIDTHTEFIASGLGHSLAICQEMSSDNPENKRSILSWGWNLSSQLGRAGPDNRPSVIEGFSEAMPIAVSGGRAHSVALTSKGEVWVWGSGRSGRLGLGSSYDEPEPILLDHLEGCQVVQAVSGFDHNVVLVVD